MSNNKNYSLNDFLPLIAIIIAIVFFTIAQRIIYGWNIIAAMNDFMGSFFIVFSLFKIYNLHNFVEAFSMYDLVAKQSTIYAYLYPFIELGLGIAYLFRFQLILTNWVTLAIMIIGSIGVAYELAQNKSIVCACLGTVFRIPMTYVTLAEDVLMAIMAIFMLFYSYQ
ncbi:MAG TPA: MauE/DoxX family redox-associated membrane protein [Candidatus Babeliales bacterium]|nr:MauE/DoxX family redox-associated membrane protein [Candidatus Babeliales bacterium]